MREQLSPSLSIREPRNRPKELELAEKTKLPKIEQEMFIERMDDADKIFRMQASEEKIIDILEKTEPSSWEQREAKDILQNELLRLFRELKESIRYAKDILASQQIKKEVLAKKEEKPKFTEPAWAKKEGMLIDVPKPKDENEELEIYIWDVVSKWSALQELCKEFFLPSQEVERIKEKMESTKQEIDKLRKLRQEYRKMAKAPEETVPQLDKEEERLNQKIADLKTQIEPQEKLCPDLRESDFLTDHSKLEILKNIAEISKNIDDLKLPAIELKKNLEEIFHITKEGALQSEEIEDTYRLILKEAPRRWGEKMQKWVEGLKENDKTRKLAEFMENLRLPRFVSEAGMAGAMILMGGYLLGGCTKVEHVKAGGEKTEEQLTPEQLTPEQIAAREAAVKIDREREMVAQAFFKGYIRIDYKPDTSYIEVENGELKTRILPFAQLDEHWTRKPIESKMFQRLQEVKCQKYTKGNSEYGPSVQDNDISQMETNPEYTSVFLNKVEATAKEMNINWNTITPEQLIKLTAKITAEHLTYDLSAPRTTVIGAIAQGRGVCDHYAAVADYLADYLIDKHKIPNITVENIISEGLNHALNIVNVVDEHGNISTSVFEPQVFKDDKTGKVNFAKGSNLDAFTWSKSKLFQIPEAEDMIAIMEQFTKPKIKKGYQDWGYIDTATQTMKEISNGTRPEDQIKYSEKMLKIFANYESDRNEQAIVWNFLINRIDSEISSAQITRERSGTEMYHGIETPSYRDLSEEECQKNRIIHYETAWKLCKLADKKFPTSRWNITSFADSFRDQIPAEFREVIEVIEEKANIKFAPRQVQLLSTPPPQ